MEIWQIILICILLFPAFTAANYFVVKRMAAERRSRDERIEQAVAKSVADSFSKSGAARYESWPKYRSRARKRQ
ncbi:MAG: hypothetical protein QUS09_04155 [Methanotrichaceae archaeon]|nr:hypothetical protein [Methanotrichaceae archaeon]